MKHNFSGAIKRLRNLHNECGMAVVALAGAVTPAELDMRGLCVVDLTDEPLEIDGLRISRKEIAPWVYGRSESRALQRDEAVLWSVQDDGMSYVGVGALTDKPTAQRLMALRRDTVRCVEVL